MDRPRPPAHRPAARSTTGSPPAPPLPIASEPCTAWLLGDLGACRAAGEAAIDRATEPSPWDGVTYTWLGASQFWLGHPEEGVAALREAIEALPRRPASTRPGSPASASSASSTTCKTTTTPRAAARRGGIGVVGEVRTGRILQAHRGRPHHPGRLAHRNDGHGDEARKELQHVVEVTHRGSGPVEIAHAQVALSIAAQAAGDAPAARRFLEDARTIIRALPRSRTRGDGLPRSSRITRGRSPPSHATADPGRGRLQRAGNRASCGDRQHPVAAGDRAACCSSPSTR